MSNVPVTPSAKTLPVRPASSPIKTTSTQWLTLQEAAREIRLSLRAFRRVIADRQIAVIEINSRVKRIERAELERFMNSKRVQYD